MFQQSIEVNNILAGDSQSKLWEFPFHICNDLSKKGEIRMKSMNLFGGNDKSSEASFGDSKPKKKNYSENFKKKAVNLASKVGVTKAAEELRVSTSSIYSWQKLLVKPSASIQDEDGNLTFSLEGRTYSLNVNSKEERERVKEEIDTNPLAKYDWFKEETGEKHWVLYNTEMYEINYDGYANRYHLNYRDRIRLAPVIPINATSCYRMFYKCTSLNKPDLNAFDTSQIINMYGMFESCENLIHLDLSNFDTSKVINMNGMFYHCKYLTQLDLSSFNTSNVTDMDSMFCLCQTLTKLDLSNFDTSNVTTMYFMFSHCYSLSQLDLSSFDTSKVFHMHYMFYACYKLTELDLSSFDTSSTYDIKLMFAWCKKLTTIYISDKWNIDSVKYSDDMFNVCRSLPGFNQEKRGIEMAKPIEDGGYLTLKKVA